VQVAVLTFRTFCEFVSIVRTNPPADGKYGLQIRCEARKSRKMPTPVVGQNQMANPR
jgi:hypothetical protein